MQGPGPPRVQQLERNALLRKDNQMMLGFLLKFEDYRSTTFTVASVSVPSTDATV